MSDYVISAQGLTRYFGSKAVARQLDLHIPHGSTLPPLPASISQNCSLAYVVGGQYVAMTQYPSMTIARIEAGDEAQWQLENVQPALFPTQGSRLVASPAASGLVRRIRCLWILSRG